MINRLIIIGNGFDIAHGLKTKYGDFIESYFSNIKDSGKWNDNFFECDLPGYLFKDCKNMQSIKDYFEKYGARVSQSSDRIKLNSSNSIKVKNSFFYNISNSHAIKNWVDIENEYFKTLISIINTEKKIETYEHLGEANILKGITKLNMEMDAVARSFENYLINDVIPKLDNSYRPILDLLNDDIYTEGSDLDLFANEFPLKYTHNNDYFSKYTHKVDFIKKYDKTLVLNFNYTSTFLSLYGQSFSNLEIINIHGSVKSKRNPINLGFGDEMNKYYGEIEDFNENEYLRLMKSFAYSDNSNYKKLFDFIESGDFQVQTMGHSCGTSDRTLLNAIFENHNCKSIKVFYHQYEDKDGNLHDNYSDIVRNISRHFNQKIMMRDKIVNKQYTEPLISA